MIHKRPEKDTVNPPGQIRNDITLGDYIERKQQAYEGTNTSHLAFLLSAGAGCISGRVDEWPQLVPACRWAADTIERLQRENDALRADAERWRNLPAVLEEFQIEYVPLLRAIDALIARNEVGQ